MIDFQEDDFEEQAANDGDTLALEVGYRAWTWSQDVNPYESNDEYEVREMIAGLTGAYYLEGVGDGS